MKRRKKKKPPKDQRQLMAKRAKWMREGAQTFHEGVTKYILDKICEELALTPKNQKIFYDEDNRKWYIADFFIPEIGLVIEIDGKSHDKKKEYDAKRTQFIESLGNKVIRFKNKEIESLEYTRTLQEVILKQCQKL